MSTTVVIHCPYGEACSKLVFVIARRFETFGTAMTVRNVIDLFTSFFHETVPFVFLFTHEEKYWIQYHRKMKSCRSWRTISDFHARSGLSIRGAKRFLEYKEIFTSLYKKYSRVASFGITRNCRKDSQTYSKKRFQSFGRLYGSYTSEKYNRRILHHKRYYRNVLEF